MLVNSGHLMNVEWEGGILEITFNDGSKYQYSDVPEGIYQELMAAPSKSLYFRQNIKGAFEYSRVS